MAKKEAASKVSMGVVFILAAFLCGALIGSAIGFFIGMKSVPEDKNVSITPSIPQGTPSYITDVGTSAVGEKVKYFIDESFLKPRGQELTIKDVNSFNEFLYVIDATVKTDMGEMPVRLYATKDGKYVLIGDVYDTNKPLKFEQPTQTPVEYKKSDRPKVLMFVMSFCPFGQQAERGLKPAIELLGDKIDFEPHYVIYSNYGTGYPEYCIDENAKYCSMHGISELKEDVRQLCIWKYERDKFWPYIEKIYQGNCNLQNIDECWKTQAETLDINVAKIEECLENEALELLAKEVELNKKYGVRGSPTILINETEYVGDRSPESFKQAICSAFNTPPEECSQTLSSESGHAGGAGGSC